MRRPLDIAPAEPPRAHAGEAVRNALKLVASLLGTWGIALGVRLLLPRALGPAQFGVVNFADALTAAVFVLAAFGVDTHLRKEGPVRENLADAFFGGLLLIRGALTLALLLGLAVLMHVTGQPPATRQTVYVFALGQFFFVSNNTFSALLHAKGRVDGLSITNVATKVLWGAGVALALFAGMGPRALAVCFTASEALRALFLYRFARRDAELKLTLDVRAALLAISASAPFFISLIAQAVASRLGASLLGFFASPTEVGFYGAAFTLAGMALLLAPLMNWVLMPFLAKTGAASEEELFRNARRALELIIAFTLPAALLLALGARVILTRLFGDAFAPAAPALSVMAPVFVLTYVAMLTSTCLILSGQPWASTRIAIGTLVLNPLLQLALVPSFGRWFGVGGAGIGAAAALLLTEVFAVVRLSHAFRGRLFDRKTSLRLLKLVAVCAIVVCSYLYLPIPEAARLLLLLPTYIVLALGVGAFPVDEVKLLARAARRRGSAV